jgi:hypothetical protein
MDRDKLYVPSTLTYWNSAFRPHSAYLCLCVFPVRYEMNFCILFRRNSVFIGLSHDINADLRIRVPALCPRNTRLPTRMDTNTNHWKTQAEIVLQNEPRKDMKNSEHRLSQRIRVVMTENISNVRVQLTLLLISVLSTVPLQNNRHTHEPRLCEFVVSLESHKTTQKLMILIYSVISRHCITRWVYVLLNVTVRSWQMSDRERCENMR